MKRALSILLGLFVLALFAGTVYFLWAKSRKPETVFQTETPKVADIVKKAVATGSVVPRREVAIKPRVSGIIDELYVEPGKAVRSGDLIARVRLVPDMVNLANAQNRVAKAKIGMDSMIPICVGVSFRLSVMKGAIAPLMTHTAHEKAK